MPGTCIALVLLAWRSQGVLALRIKQAGFWSPALCSLLTRAL